MGFRDANTIFETDLKRLTEGNNIPRNARKELTIIAKAGKYELPASYEFAKRINETIVTTEITSYLPLIGNLKILILKKLLKNLICSLSRSQEMMDQKAIVPN
ncbi:hypothetical protein ACP8HZ_05150 [Francisella noatunensis]